MDIAALIEQVAAANPMPNVQNPAPITGAVVHVDGDYAAYYCAGNDNTDPAQARRNLLARFEKVKWVSGATKVLVHLTSGASTKGERYLAATVKPYQGQRKKGKPKNWGVLRDFMENYEGDKFERKMWDTREADDGIAYVTHAAAQHGTLAMIATRDKDMRMLPGRHIMWMTHEIFDVPFGTFEAIGPDGELYGRKWFWKQMLQGDSADNIPGIPLIGEVTASEYLEDVHTNEDAVDLVTTLYKKKYGPSTEWADRMAEQACLLWLRTDRFASVRNFTEAWGEVLDLDIQRAASRLQERIKKDREQLERLRH